MPRTSERACVLESIEDAIVTEVCSYLLASGDEEEEEEDIEDIEDLLELHEIVASHRYLSHDTSASRHHDSDILEAYIREYPEAAFLALFRMYRASFWQLVEVLTKAGGETYWDCRTPCRRSPRPIY